MADHARGENFVRLRKARHLSQESAAHQLGVSVQTIRAWERGKGIRWENAKRAADFYDVEPDELVDRELTVPQELDPDQLNRIEQKLDRVLKRMEELEAEQVEHEVASALDEDREPQRGEQTGG